jgi:hypothetical protein
MAELDGKDDRKIVDDVMKLFKIPNDIKHLVCFYHILCISLGLTIVQQ